MTNLQPARHGAGSRDIASDKPAKAAVSLSVFHNSNKRNLLQEESIRRSAIVLERSPVSSSSSWQALHLHRKTWHRRPLDRGDGQETGEEGEDSSGSIRREERRRKGDSSDEKGNKGRSEGSAGEGGGGGPREMGTRVQEAKVTMDRARR